MTGEPLLPSLVGNPVLDAALRDSLRILRDEADEPGVRRRIEDVLSGRATLRELARDQEFAQFVSPLAARGWAEYEQIDPEERDRLVAEVADLDRHP